MGGWQGDWRVRGEQEVEGRHQGREAAMAQGPSWSVHWAPGGTQRLGPGLTVLEGKQTGCAEGVWWALSSAHLEATQCLQRGPPPNQSLQGEGSAAAGSLLPRSRHFPGGFCSPVAGLGTCGTALTRVCVGSCLPKGSRPWSRSRKNCFRKTVPLLTPWILRRMYLSHPSTGGEPWGNRLGRGG